MVYTSKVLLLQKHSANLQQNPTDPHILRTRANLVPTRGKKSATEIISALKVLSPTKRQSDMLSPLRPSAPSASLLRFLRSQTGFASASSICVRPRPRTPSHDHAATGSLRRSSGWARFIKSGNGTAFGTGHLKTSCVIYRAPVSVSCSNSVVPVRHASTARRPLLRRLFELKRGKAAEYKQSRNGGPGLIDEGPEGIFNIGRGLAAKASNELRLRCTEFDMNGNVTLVNGEFRKLELIAKVGFPYRARYSFKCSLLTELRATVRPSSS